MVNAVITVIGNPKKIIFKEYKSSLLSMVDKCLERGKRVAQRLLTFSYSIS